MAAVGGLEAEVAPADDSKQKDFISKWKPPRLESGFSSKVQAVVDDTRLTNVEVQFIFDFYKNRTGKDITLKILLDECEKYENGQQQFPERIRKFTPGGGNRGNQNRRRGGSGVDVSDGQPVTSPQASNSRTNEVETDVVPDSALSEQSTSSVRSITSGMSQVQITVGGSETRPAAAPPVADNVRVSRMSPIEKERWLLQNRLLALQREHDILDMARKCNECKTRPRDITFLPCGHFTMCKTCSEPVYECPTCQKDILATAQTYLS